MIVKIMTAAGSSFPGINYNEKKIEKGKGELLMMKNFPSFFNASSKKEQVKNYLKAISNKNSKVQKPQFHAMISTKFQKHSKEELANIAEEFMEGMGYGKQPYVVVFHNDTDNNHVHLVTTRVQNQSGKKINDSYEKLRSQKVLAQVMEKLYEIKLEEQLERLLSYKISSQTQLELLLDRNGFKTVKNKNNENQIDILSNGIKKRSIALNELKNNSGPNEIRMKQLKAILIKYKEIYSNKVFAVHDSRKMDAMLPHYKLSNRTELKNTKVEYESELQKKMRDIFGLDLVFHHSDQLKPFGYTIIDHKTSQVFKGSQILKLNDLFEVTSSKLDKRLFEVLKDYNIPSVEIKRILMDYINEKFPQDEVTIYMLFENKGKKDLESYRKVQLEVNDYLFHSKCKSGPENIKLITGTDDRVYAIHERHHYIGELKHLIGEKQFERFLENGGVVSSLIKSQPLEKKEGGVKQAINELFFELMKPTKSLKDPFENDRKKKRKKRK